MPGGYLRAAGCFHNHHHSWLNMGSWNIRLLVESESSVVTVSTRRGVQVDRKVNLLVGELCCFDLSITGISETKWFGQGVYEVDGFVLVHYSGRPTPADGELVQRNEGVGILLNPVMAVAWRDSIVSVCIQLHGCTSCNFNRQSDKIDLTVISVYAPTFCSHRTTRISFMMT